MVDFPVYGFDMSPHLAKHHNINLNNVNNDQQNVILNGGWSPWKRSRKQSNANDNMYDLYAVCYHHGTDIETGHYTAACKNPYDNQWYMYDDAKVTNLSQQTNDISSVLVNNSAYILFYQKRSGIYVSSSSNSSSAASTSSVGSAGDHWVSRMPKFTLPKKTDKQKINKPTTPPAAKPVNNTNTTTTESIDLITNALEVDVTKSKTVDDVVTLRNSQNALYSSNGSVRKSLENKSTTTTSELRSSSETIRNSQEKVSSNKSLNSSNTRLAEPKKPIYTTSIYINASGNVDITTTCDKSPVLSLHRVNGIAEDDVKIHVNDLGNQCEFIDEPEDCLLSERTLSSPRINKVLSI